MRTRFFLISIGLAVLVALVLRNNAINEADAFPGMSSGLSSNAHAGIVESPGSYKGQVKIGEWIDESEDVVIDETGATWDGYMEVIWLELDASPTVRIRAPGTDPDEPAGHRDLVVCTDDTVGPTDLIHTTEPVPYGICGGELWTIDFRIDVRARSVRAQLRLEDQDAVLITAELESRKDFMIGAYETSAYQTNSFVGDNVAGLYAFRRCVLYEPPFGGF